MGGEIISMQLAALSALLVIASVPMGVLAAQADPGLFDLQNEENIALREEQGSMGASSLQKMQKLKQKALHQASREVKVKQQRKAEQAASNSISDGQTSAMLALGNKKTFSDSQADFGQTTAKMPKDAMVQEEADIQKKKVKKAKADAKDAQAKGYKDVPNWHAKYAADHGTTVNKIELKKKKAKMEAKKLKAEDKKVRVKAQRSEEISHDPRKPTNSFMRHHPGAAKAEIALDAKLEAKLNAKLKPKGAKQPKQPITKHKSVDQKVQAAKPGQGKHQHKLHTTKSFMRDHPGAAKAEIALDAKLNAKLKPKGAKQPKQPITKHKSVDQKVQAAKPGQGKQQTFMKVSKESQAAIKAQPKGKQQTFMKVSKAKPAKLGASQDAMNKEEIKAKTHAYTEALKHGASQGATNIDEIKAKGRMYMDALRRSATPSAAADAAGAADLDLPPSHAAVTPIQ